MVRLSSQHLKADLALIFVTLSWGLTFVIVQNALADIQPYYFLAIRFILATLFLCAVFFRRFARLNFQYIKSGFLIGVLLFGGYAFQTIGLQYTSASNSGFITGLSVVMVPLFVAVYKRRLPPIPLILGVICATLGLALLSLNESLSFNYGDILTLFCAACFALHILAVSHFTRELSPELLTIMQIATVALLSLVFAVFQEHMPVQITLQVWQAILITSFFATAMAFTIQNKVQKYTSPTHTAIIFTTEPVFAALAAYVFNHEILVLRQIFGCILILSGMLLVELKNLTLSNTKQNEKAPPTVS